MISNKLETSARRRARLSIGLRLLVIVSLLLVLALGSMILFASSLFRQHSEGLIQEYNLSLARLIGMQVDEDLLRLSQSARELQEDGGDLAAAEPFFARNESVLWVRMPGSASSPNELWNERLLLRYGLRRKAVQDLLAKARVREGYSASSIADLQLRRFEGAGFPALVATVRSNRGPILVLLSSEALLGGLSEMGHTQLFQLYLVNERAEVLAHSSPNAQGTGEIESTRIIQSMLQGGHPNGSSRYDDPRGIQHLGSYQMLETTSAGIVSTVPADHAFEAVYLIQRQNIEIMVIVLAIGIVFVYFFARRLTAPIKTLAQATREVEAGNYDIALEARTNDEVGDLTRSFGSMLSGLRERERIKQTFGKFVNPLIVDRALQEDIRLGGEIKTATVLFSDLRNFTAMSERLAPDQVVAILSEYFTRMVACIHRTGGVVDKFIGDAIMAHWGAVATTDSDVQNAVDAAIAMRYALNELNHTVLEERGIHLHSGCGLNAGPVLAGQIGSEERLEYTVIGDTVNLASRIEYLNKHFGSDILVSESIQRQLGPRYRLEKLPEVRIKGKSESATVYAVLGHEDDSRTPATLYHLRERLGIDFDSESRERTLQASADVILDAQQEAPR